MTNFWNLLRRIIHRHDYVLMMNKERVWMQCHICKRESQGIKLHGNH